MIDLHISSHSLQSHTQTFWFFCLLILHNQGCAFAACSWKKNCQQCTLGRTVGIEYCEHTTRVPRQYAVHHYHKPLFPLSLHYTHQPCTCECGYKDAGYSGVSMYASCYLTYSHMIYMYTHKFHLHVFFHDGN